MAERKRKKKVRQASGKHCIYDLNPIISIKTFVQRVMDDDRLSDSCWNLETKDFHIAILFAKKLNP